MIHVIVQSLIRNSRNKIKLPEPPGSQEQPVRRDRTTSIIVAVIVIAIVVSILVS